MIHFLVWLAEHTSRSFALGVTLLLMLGVGALGVTGRILVLGAFAVSVVAYAAPAAVATAFGYFGVAAVICAAVLVVAALVVRLIPTHYDQYIAAVRSGDTSKWWQPTRGERLAGVDQHLAPEDPDPTAQPDRAAVAELHQMYRAQAAEAAGLVPPGPRVPPPNGLPRPPQ